MKSLSTVLCTALLACAPAVSATPHYTLSLLPEPPDGALGVHDLGGFNNAGQLAATWTTAAFAAHPYLYTPGTGFSSLLPPGPAPGGFDDWRIYDLNNRGVAVGNRIDRAWQYAPSGGGPVPGTAGVADSVASAINDAGQVAGWANGGGYLYTPGQGSVVLPADRWAMDINNTGTVLLGSPGGPLSTLYRYDIATAVSTPIAMDPTLDPANLAVLNDRGDVVAGHGVRLNLGVAIYHPDGTFTRLPDMFPGSGELASDINNEGWVVGRAIHEGPVPGDDVLFLYTPEGGMQDLVALIDPTTLQGWQNLSPRFINDRGDIAGLGYFDGERRVFVLSSVAAPVPEPGLALLTGLGLFGVVAGVRRRQAAAASRNRANHADCPVL